MQKAYLLANFGGPRERKEIEPFLRELFFDRDVIRTKYPAWLHNWLFGRIAAKRSLKIADDYHRIGYSPIYRDTEAIAKALEPILDCPVLTFHRYLPETHPVSLLKIETCQAEEICVIPLFPQFCYGTTGSIARFLHEKLSLGASNKLKWIKSYPDNPYFVGAWQNQIRKFLTEQKLEEHETILFFSAHGVPQAFIDEGDPYEEECERSVSTVMQAFPNISWRLAYQSKFGRGEWLRPYTDEECNTVLAWAEGKKQIVFIPISFTSDHIETLFEIEELYLPIIRSNGLNAHRCPALNLEDIWISALGSIAKQEFLCSTKTLIRSKCDKKRAKRQSIFSRKISCD